MFFVMVEISNYRQLSRLRADEAAEVRGLLEHIGGHRGGRLAREQNGFFLFAFHPLREKVLDHVSDFLFLCLETLDKKRESLFGYSVLLEQDEVADEAGVFTRLKTLIFQAPREGKIWAGPQVLSHLAGRFPVGPEEPLAEILGPPARTLDPPLPIEELVEMTGWIEALRVPLSRQLATSEGRTGKILRLKGHHLTEKYSVLKMVLHQIYGSREDFPVLFPLEESRDFLSQLLARVDPDIAAKGPVPAEPAWAALLASRGSGDYPGDSGREDVVGALSHYFRTVIAHLGAQGLPPVFVFLLPQRYEPSAQAVLEGILGDLVTTAGLKLLLLEPQDEPLDFLGRQPSLTWSFPPLSFERIQRERDARGWQERFPQLDRAAFEACGGRGLSWAHHLWSLQDQRAPGRAGEDPSWTLLDSLDSSHKKVYFVLWAGRGLLEEDQLSGFFQGWGEDKTVIEDKVQSLRAMGFLLSGLNQPLRPDFGPRLAEQLGEEGRALLTGLGKHLHKAWKKDHRLSEVLFGLLAPWGLAKESVEVLTQYLTDKINQGSGDFLPLLRRSLWETSPTEEIRERLRLVAASAKLRYALNLPGHTWQASSLDRYRRFFTKKTEASPDGEWQLQQGRFALRAGDLSGGFSLLKRALAEAQTQGDPSLEVRAQLEIGLALMRKDRLEEAREYFDIAVRLAEKTTSPYLVVQTCALDAVALFLLGHLTSAAQAVDRGWAACERGGLQQRKVFLAFLGARIRFDQGAYTEASDQLQRAAAIASRYKLTDALPVLTAWRGRSEALAGNTAGARRLLEGLESSAERSYFLAEAAWLDRDLAEARSRALEALGLVKPTRPFGCGEQADWSSGWASLEDRALARPGDVGVLRTQIEGFLAFIEGLSGDVDGASATFQELLARKALLELDPASAQFYYWYFLVLPKASSAFEAQRLTLLGRALKDIQVRSSRIEDPVQRQEYLSRPYWNSQFTLEAKKLKLL